MCWFRRQEQINGWRGNRRLTSKKTALPVGWLGCKIYTETSRCEACQKQVYINTHNKVTNRWANGWMESWLRNVEMMDPRPVNMRRQINTPSERRTELDDRMLAKVSTHRCTQKNPKTKQTNNSYSIILPTDIVKLRFSPFDSWMRVVVCVVSRTCSCYLLCCWTSHVSGQITIRFMCFLTPWQVNKAGANANKEVLSDFSEKKHLKKWQPNGVHRTFVPTLLSNMTRWLLQQNQPFDLPKDKQASIQRFRKKLNNNWLKWLCNQSCHWEKNKGLCNICNIVKVAFTTSNITVSPQS